MSTDRCSEQVTDYTLNWPRPHQCQRKWKVEEDNKRYCTQHSPIKVMERRTASDAKYREQIIRLNRPHYIQKTLNQLREDLIDLKSNLGPDGYWHDQPDIELRVENWHFNTWQRMEKTLQEG